MFGHSSRRRQRRRERSQRATSQSQPQVPKPNPEAEEKLQINERVKEAATARQQAREEGRKYAEQELNRDVQGLTPQQRSAMQYEASQQIQRQHQSANRKLLGEQSQRGIVGRGGVGEAQRRALQRAANDSQNQVTRDIQRLDADETNKKRLASVGLQQGEAVNDLLDRQSATDELRLKKEQERARRYEDERNRSFNRL